MKCDQTSIRSSLSHTISVINLPAYQGQTVILVVIDHFFKAAHFGTLPTHCMASKKTEPFSQMICELHG